MDFERNSVNSDNEVSLQLPIDFDKLQKYNGEFVGGNYEKHAVIDRKRVLDDATRGFLIKAALSGIGTASLIFGFSEPSHPVLGAALLGAAGVATFVKAWSKNNEN